MTFDETGRENGMTLRDQGFRFVCNGTQCKWVAPHAVGGWTDCTDMDDAQFDAFMLPRLQNAAKDNQ